MSQQVNDFPTDDLTQIQIKYYGELKSKLLNQDIVDIAYFFLIGLSVLNSRSSRFSLTLNL